MAHSTGDGPPDGEAVPGATGGASQERPDATGVDDERGRTDGADPALAVLDWIGAFGIALYGVLLAFTGVDLLRQHLDGGIDGEATAGIYSASEATIPTATSASFLLFGLCYVVAGGWYAVTRRRNRRDEAVHPRLRGRVHLVSSAGGAVLFAFTMVSPLVAGAVAGYLEPGNRSATRAGGLAGGLAVVFLLAPLLLTFSVSAGGAFYEVNVFLAGISILLFGLLSCILGLALAAGTAALAAVGGWIGGTIADRS